MALIQNRLGFSVLSDFMSRIDRTVNIYWIDVEIHTRAWELLLENQGATLSFVDWTLALVSRTLDAPVFTFDSGFANQGVFVTPS